MTSEIVQLNPARMFHRMSESVTEKLTLTWGEYFKFLSDHTYRRLEKDVSITVQDRGKGEDARCVKKRRVLVMKTNDLEGSAGFTAFAYDENIRDGKLTLVKLTIACQSTGRTEHVNITPTLMSSQGILKALTKNVPRMVKQYTELMHRI